MFRNTRKWILFIALPHFVGVTVQGWCGSTVIVDQPHINAGNPSPGSSGVFSSFDTNPAAVEEPHDSQTYDDFLVSSPIFLNEISWTGSFGGSPVPDGVLPSAQPGGLFNPRPISSPIRSDLDFRISIFGSTGAEPNVGNVIFSQILDAGLAGMNVGTQVTTSLIPGESTSTQGLVFAYHTDSTLGLNSTLLQPGEYWLSIEALQNFPSPHPDDENNTPPSPNTWVDPSYGNHFGSGGNGTSYSYDDIYDRPAVGGGGRPGIPVNVDLAFTLKGDLVGDFDKSGSFTVSDIDMLSAAIQSGSLNLQYDVNQDGLVNAIDCSHMITEIVGTLPGDTNLDFQVTLGDFTRLAASYNKEGGWAAGDNNCSGTVSLSDFVELAKNYNQVAGGHVRSVPEPDANVVGWLACISFCLAVARRAPFRNQHTINR